METVVIIEKIIEGYDCGEVIKKFIDLSLFTHKIIAVNRHYNNICSALKFLMEVQMRFELLSDD